MSKKDKDVSSDMISVIYDTRVNLIKQLKYRGFNTDGYDQFSINDVNSMMFSEKVQQLDLLLENTNTNKKILVKYYLARKINKDIIQDMVEDVFKIEKIINKDDDLLIITKEYANDTILATLKEIWEKENIYIGLTNMYNLRFNILEHTLVPPHRCLTDEEKQNIKSTYNIIDDKQFPEISRFDPVALTIGLRPSQLCEIIRPSKTAITTPYYRICV